jgi:hypothetical protein
MRMGSGTDRDSGEVEEAQRLINPSKDQLNPLQLHSQLNNEGGTTYGTAGDVGMRGGLEKRKRGEVRSGRVCVWSVSCGTVS